MNHLSRALFAVLIVALLPRPAAAQCTEGGGQLQVLVKAKTAIRRGPGLNYPVSAFVEDGRCMKSTDISVDGNWVMVEDPVTKNIGWIPTKQLDPGSLELIQKERPAKGPVGSGQERGYVNAKAQTGLKAEPRQNADEKRSIAAGTRLLALAITEDKAWVQVRNERNETGWVEAAILDDGDTGTLAALPVATQGLKTGIKAGDKAKKHKQQEEAPAIVEEAPPPPPPASAETEKPPTSVGMTGLDIDAAVLGTFALPRHGLDSNGVSGQRRYAVRANAGGAQIEFRAAHVGPFRARLGYGLVLISGLAEASAPNETVTAQEHQGRVSFGFPIGLGPLTVMPEVGYSLWIYAMTPALPSSLGPQFFSSHAHLAMLGLNLRWDPITLLTVEAEVHGLLGVTGEYPFHLGSSGLSTGVRAGADLRLNITQDLGVLVRWAFVSTKAPYKGLSDIDATITEATLLHVENSFGAGVAAKF